MNQPEYNTYWYKNADGEFEIFEVSDSDDPPRTIHLPSFGGTEAFTLVFDDLLYADYDETEE